MPVTIEDVERVLAGLRLPDTAAREALMEELRAWEKERLPTEVAERVLRGAAETYPAVDGWPPTPNEQLVRLLWNGPPVAPATVLAVYPRLDEECRASVLRLLAMMPSRDASAALAKLLEDGCESGALPDVYWPVLLPLEGAPRDADVLAGPLIRCLERNLWPRIAAATLLGYAQAGLIDDKQRKAIAAAVGPNLARLLASLGKPPREEEEKNEYLSRRSDAGLLLDLVGELKGEDSVEILAKGAQHEAAWLALWGVLGLIKCGATPPQQAIDKVAADAEARSVLFARLGALDRLDLFPARYRTQSALAESDMVRWLMYPTELAQAPDAIEEARVVPIETNDGAADLYVYKFRTFEPHWAAEKGWMVGVAGPFVQREQPTIRSLGATFSRFEPLDDKPLEEHVREILGTLEEWAEAAERRGG
jgi:hypothetical protein